MISQADSPKNTEVSIWLSVPLRYTSQSSLVPLANGKDVLEAIAVVGVQLPVADGKVA
jgi:hypothetical protein